MKSVLYICSDSKSELSDFRDKIMLARHRGIGEFRRFHLFFRDSEYSDRNSGNSGCNNYSECIWEMFTSYTDRVFKTYQNKKEEGILSLNLIEPTPAKLKQECSIVYSERYKEKDSKTLRLFFLPKDDFTDYGVSIRNIDTDKFKPLSNFLKGRTTETEDKNIELLAWLIDFEPRPYNFKYDYDTEKDIDVRDGEVDEKSENNDPLEKEGFLPVPEEKIVKKTARGSDLKKILIGSVLSSSIILVGYLGLKKGTDKKETYQEKIVDSSGHRRALKNDEKAITQKKADEIKEDAKDVNRKAALVYIPQKKEMQCMYWKDDHYQEAFCDDENVPASLIALDKNLVKHFRKITFPDTITEKSVDKIWYLKSDGKIEFFTHEGNHPTNHRKLKKMTKYILDKHVYN